MLGPDHYNYHEGSPLSIATTPTINITSTTSTSAIFPSYCTSSGTPKPVFAVTPPTPADVSCYFPSQTQWLDLAAASVTSCYGQPPPPPSPAPVGSPAGIATALVSTPQNLCKCHLPRRIGPSTGPSLPTPQQLPESETTTLSQQLHPHS